MKKHLIYVNHARNRGFSMIELSIVMVIIGLIVSMGISVYGPSMKTALKGKNETVVQNAVDSLVGYAGAHRNLPSSLTTAARSSKDAQDNTLQYKPASNLLAADAVCDQTTTSLSVTVNLTTPFTVPDVAYIVWSKGYNGTSEVNDDVTTDSYQIFPYSDIVPTPSGKQDDLAGWATLSELKAAAGCGGAMKIFANALSAGKESQLTPFTYGAAGGGINATITVSGGVPFANNEYKWCVVFPEATGSGVLVNNLVFSTPSVASVTPGTVSGDCAAPNDLGTMLIVNGSNPFDLGDSGTSSMTVYVMDSVGQITSKIFPFYVVLSP